MTLRRLLVRALCLVAAITAVTLATTERVTGSGVSDGASRRAARRHVAGARRARLRGTAARHHPRPARQARGAAPEPHRARRPGAVRPPVHRRDHRRRARTGPWPAGRRGPDVVDCGRCRRAPHGSARQRDDQPDECDQQPAEDRGQRDSSWRGRHIGSCRAAVGPAQYARRGRLTLDRTRRRDRGDRLGPGDVGGVPGTGHRVLRHDRRPHGGDIAV